MFQDSKIIAIAEESWRNEYIGGQHMNHNVKNVILTYSVITGNENKKDIIETLSRSNTFRNLQKGDKVLLYEGYTANLLEIVNELKQQKNCPMEVHKVTPDMVRVANRARRKGYGIRRIELRIPKVKGLSKSHFLKQ